MRDSDDFVARVTDNRIRPAAHGGMLSFRLLEKKL
jgi:hypothetical protein